MSSRDDYVEVAERLQEFYAKYPEGSLQGSWEWTADGSLIVYRAAAYRTPDDARPGVGYAQEPYPGKTAFTKGSELQNAETSAWGRAMAALGIATKKGIASAHEVRLAKARQQSDRQQTDPEPIDSIAELIVSATTPAELDALVDRIKASDDPTRYRELWSKQHRRVTS